MTSSDIERYTAPPVESRAAVEVVNERTDGWVRVIQPIAELASQVVGTEFVPVAIRQKQTAIAAAILFGRELDMPPMQALQQVHVIEGRPSLSAEHMRAMVLAAGHEVSYDLSVPMQVTAIGRRWIGRNQSTGLPTYGTPTSVTWNLAMAERASLMGKNNWKRHPRQMLEARATAELCRLIFADVTHGLPSVEEMEDGGLFDEQPVDASAPAPASTGRSKVSRAKPRGRSKAADGPAPVNPPVSESVPSAPRPPLPSQVGPEDAAPSEPVPPAAPVSEGDVPTYPPQGERKYQGPYAVSEGDGSFDDVAATGDDESYMQARFREQEQAAEQAVDAEVVPDRPEGIHAGQKRALEAAFSSLAVKDRAEVHHAASALLGRRVTTLGPVDGDNGGLTSEDGSRLLSAFAKIRDRDQLEAMIQQAAEQWEENRDA